MNGDAGSTETSFPGAGFFERLGVIAREDAEMRAIGRFFEIEFAVVCGERTTLIEIGPGLELRAVADLGIGSAWSFTLRGNPEDWERFLRPVPPAHYSDVLGMNRHSDTFSLEGDRRVFVRHLRCLHRLFELARMVGRDEDSAPGEPPVNATGDRVYDGVDDGTSSLESIVGRYLRVEIGGVRQRIFFEEAGEGRPLLCLHTAGSDSRQYRHLLSDEEVTSRWRVISFDLPAHGRSLPPDGWWKEEYLLTTKTYAETVMAVMRALRLSDPVVLGCSMGGTVVLELARSCPDEIGGVIALEAASKIEGRFLDWSIIPDAGGSTVSASWTYGLMAPQSPDDARREVWWGYAQGGPGVYRGDTYFYAVDWDIRGRETEIDTAACPVHMMTGEYDHACTPAESRRTADAIPGAEFTEMKGLGHFPMAENYPLFKGYLMPALDRMLVLRE